MPQLGLLFDLDGTLTNSDPWHFEAFGRLLQEFGRNLTHDDFTAHISGGENAAVMRFLFPGVLTSACHPTLPLTVVKAGVTFLLNL